MRKFLSINFWGDYDLVILRGVISKHTLANPNTVNAH